VKLWKAVQIIGKELTGLSVNENRAEEKQMLVKRQRELAEEEKRAADEQDRYQT